MVLGVSALPKLAQDFEKLVILVSNKSHTLTHELLHTPTADFNVETAGTDEVAVKKRAFQAFVVECSVRIGA
jgi:hypothetical protein